MKNSLIKKCFVAAVFAFAVIGCATSKTEKQVNAELKAEPEIKSTADLQQEADQLIAKSSFTEKQKAALLELRHQSVAQQAALREESLKLRSLLIKSLISSKYNKKEVAVIEKDYKKVEDKRVALLFQTVEKANDILDRNVTPEAEKVFDQMMFDREFRNY